METRVIAWLAFLAAGFQYCTAQQVCSGKLTSFACESGNGEGTITSDSQLNSVTGDSDGSRKTCFFSGSGNGKGDVVINSDVNYVDRASFLCGCANGTGNTAVNSKFNLVGEKSLAMLEKLKNILRSLGEDWPIDPPDSGSDPTSPPLIDPPTTEPDSDTDSPEPSGEPTPADDPVQQMPYPLPCGPTFICGKQPTNARPYIVVPWCPRNC